VSTFDLRAPVGDVAWAPASSTVFAAATDSGKVAVFDLERCRDAPVCVQRVARKSRLTRIAFNARHPVLLVGTEHGAVVCLKLSPNLRRTFNPGKRRLPAHLCMPADTGVDPQQAERLLQLVTLDCFGKAVPAFADARTPAGSLYFLYISSGVQRRRPCRTLAPSGGRRCAPPRPPGWMPCWSWRASATRRCRRRTGS
jgi:hypothetical protein